MNQNKTITLYKILLFLIGVLLVWALLPKCGSSEIPNSSNIRVDTLRIYSVKVDSIDVIRIKQVNKWHSIRDTINIHDTIQVINALNLCDTIIVVDSLEIAFLKTINRNFAKVVHNDSIIIDSLKHSKKKFWRGFKYGYITGAGTTAIGVGALLIK